MEKEAQRGDFTILPEGCVALIISLTTPSDACRLASVSRIFKSAAESDVVWERFLPTDYAALLPSLLFFSSKKKIFFYLCENPVLVDDGKMSILLDKWSAKKKFMLAASHLDFSPYDTLISLPESRFEKVISIDDTLFIEIKGKINTHMLSPNTQYSANLVYRMGSSFYGLGDVILPEAYVGLVGGHGHKTDVAIVPEEYWEKRCYYGDGDVKESYLNLPKKKRPQKRGDGWLEVELGEYFKAEDAGDDQQLEMSITEDVTYGSPKGGLIVEGIEVKPQCVELEKAELKNSNPPPSPFKHYNDSKPFGCWLGGTNGEYGSNSYGVSSGYRSAGAYGGRSGANGGYGGSEFGGYGIYGGVGGFGAYRGDPPIGYSIYVGGANNRGYDVGGAYSYSGACKGYDPYSHGGGGCGGGGYRGYDVGAYNYSGACEGYGPYSHGGGGGYRNNHDICLRGSYGSGGAGSIYGARNRYHPYRR